MGSDQDVAEKFPTIPHDGRLEPVGKSLSTVVTAHDALATVCTGRHVVDCTREFDSQWEGHAENAPRQTALHNAQKDKIDLTPQTQRSGL